MVALYGSKVGLPRRKLSVRAAAKEAGTTAADVSRIRNADLDRFSLDRPTAERAEAGLRRLLPGLAGVRVERAWGGPIDVSADHLPFFRTKPGTRIHYGAGYSGHGVGPAAIGASL